MVAFFSLCSKSVARRFLRRVQGPGIISHCAFEETNILCCFEGWALFFTWQVSVLVQQDVLTSDLSSGKSLCIEAKELAKAEAPRPVLGWPYNYCLLLKILLLSSWCCYLLTEILILMAPKLITRSFLAWSVLIAMFMSHETHTRFRSSHTERML